MESVKNVVWDSRNRELCIAEIAILVFIDVWSAFDSVCFVINTLTCMEVALKSVCRLLRFAWIPKFCSLTIEIRRSIV